MQHPGYGCWLSGIDVNNQASNQKFQDPWLAIVVDPVRTIAQGKVQLGAFRTYPDDYKPADAAQDVRCFPLLLLADVVLWCWLDIVTAVVCYCAESTLHYSTKVCPWIR